MVKIKVSYNDNAEFQTIINLLSINYKLVDIKPEYKGNGKGNYKRGYITLEQK